AVDRALEHALERNSTENTKKVIAYGTALGYGHLTVDQVEKELRSRDNVIYSTEHTIEKLTTKELVAEEDRMIEMAVAGKGQFPALNKDYIPQATYLNGQQQDAIKELLSSYDQTVILHGSAGVGKTTLLTEVRKGAASAGRELIAVAPSSQASAVLAEKGFQSTTVASLLTNKQLQQQLQHNVLLIDEAGMCGVRSMSRLLELGKKHNSRIILSGDTQQNGPPAQYGDSLRILKEQANLKVVIVDKILRQKDPSYNRAVTDIAKGNLAKGYKSLDKQGKVKEIGDHEERVVKIAEDYADTLDRKESVIVVSPTHFEGDKINEAIRSKLKEKGRIKGKEQVFEVLRDLSFTNAQ
ncbi:MAG: AAA family ATPase, partial [Bacteroidota bacterium]